MLTQEIWDKFLDDVNNNNVTGYTGANNKILENDKWNLELLLNLLARNYLEEKDEIIKILLEQGGLLDNQEEIPIAFFSFCDLTDIKLPNTLTHIYADAFSWSINLKAIVIPKSVKYIGSDAFLGCKKLTIYCEASSQSSEWSGHWNYSNRPVYWAGEWEYDSNGNPQPKK